MRLHNLKPTPGSRQKSRKRLGRGTATGQGKTAGRGQDGQNSRSGGGVRLGFEGGQNPLLNRLPKRGFNNAAFRKTYSIVNLSDLNRFEGDTVTAETLKEAGIISKINDGVKILGNGELDKKLDVKVSKVSNSAKEAIENKGGKVEVI